MGSRRQSILALRRVINTFGPGAAVLQQPPLPRAKRERAAMRIDVDVRISNCTACDLRDRCDHPLTPEWGSLGAARESSVAVIRACPSYEEERFGGLGVGPAARMVQAELGDLSATWLNAVQCTPLNNRQAGSKTDDPTAGQLSTCRQHVLDALDAADVAYVLLLGATPTGMWRKDLPLANVAGRWGIWNQRWLVMPTYDPKYLMRSDATIDRDEWRKHLHAFRDAARGERDLELLHGRCMACGDKLFGYDEDGVAWCDTHFETGAMGAAKPTRKRRNPNQGALI